MNSDGFSSIFYVWQRIPAEWARFNIIDCGQYKSAACHFGRHFYVSNCTVLCTHSCRCAAWPRHRTDMRVSARIKFPRGNNDRHSFQCSDGRGLVQDVYYKTNLSLILDAWCARRCNAGCDAVESIEQLPMFQSLAQNISESKRTCFSWLSRCFGGVESKIAEKWKSCSRSC